MSNPRTARPLVVLAVLVACGQPPPTMAPPDLSDELEAPGPRIAGIELPRLPEDVTPEDEELRLGWELAEAALTMPAPRPPTGEAWEVETWADDALADWMQRRAAAVAEVQRALDEARHGDPEVSVVASTLLGLAYARFAMDVRGLETPNAFREDPVRGAAYRQAMESAAQPLWARALDAFGSCAAVATRVPAHGLARWRERCDEEGREASSMLPDTDTEADEEVEEE